MVPFEDPGRLREPPEATAIAANIPGVVFRFFARSDGKRGLLFVGERCQQLVGIPAAPLETLFERFLGHVKPEQRAPFLASIDVAVRDRSPWSFEAALLFANSEERWFHAGAQPVAVGEETVFDGVLLDITEQMRAVEALRRSEANLQAIMANTTDIIASYDRERRLVAYNQACSNVFRELFGVDIHPGFRIIDALPETMREFWNEHYARVLVGESFSNEFELLSADGVRRVFESSYHPMRHGGEIVGFITSARDITQRKRMEEALRESERQFQTMFELAPYACTVSDTERRYLKVNQAFCKEMELTPEAAIGRTPSELGIAIEDSFPLGASSELERSGPTEYLEANALVSGRALNLICSSRRIVFAGEPAYLSIAVDVSNMKRAERALRDSEERFRRLLQNSNDVIAIVEEGGTFVVINGALSPVLGYELEDLLGANGFDLVHADDLDRVRGVFAKLQEAPGVAQQLQFRSRHKNGTWIWLEAVASSLLDDLPAKRIVLNVRDISARRKAEEEHARLQAQLTQAQKMESVGRLAGGVAHDFNNMLGAILGHAELAMEHLAPTHPLYADLQEIYSAAQRSAALTRQLLAFARRQTIAPKVIDINETVDGMLKMLRRIIGEDIQLVWRPGADASVVKIDPSQVDQVLANLCVNARDAIAGTGKVIIETGRICFDEEYCASHAGVVPGDFVQLAVSDDGVGMDAETRSHLFEPFFTTKEMGKDTGLGLATVFGIVKQNNGFISVYSEPGQGTTFKIYLPSHPLGSDTQTRASSMVVDSGRETILLVEDEPTIRQVTARMLQRLGHVVVVASTPSEAIHLAHECRGTIDLLLTDVVMPEMNGRDLATKVASLCPGIKCLFMSGYTANVIVHHGVLDEGVVLLQKPFSVAVLASKVREALSQE